MMQSRVQVKGLVLQTVAWRKKQGKRINVLIENSKAAADVDNVG